eukprot:11226163-Lingulodinium_polyedra.AAC.1
MEGRGASPSHHHHHHHHITTINITSPPSHHITTTTNTNITTITLLLLGWLFTDVALELLHVLACLGLLFIAVVLELLFETAVSHHTPLTAVLCWCMDAPASCMLFGLPLVPAKLMLQLFLV